VAEAGAVTRLASAAMVRRGRRGRAHRDRNGARERTDGRRGGGGDVPLRGAVGASGGGGRGFIRAGYERRGGARVEGLEG
jgi:hypothetical protein